MGTLGLSTEFDRKQKAYCVPIYKKFTTKQKTLLGFQLTLLALALTFIYVGFY